MAKYEGFDATSFKRDLRRLGREARASVPRAVDEASRLLAREIRSRCPEDTGHLKDSVKVVPARTSGGEVVQEVEVGEERPADGRWYVGFVEYGARDVPARPFIRPAVAAKEAEMARIIEGALPRE